MSQRGARGRGGSAGGSRRVGGGQSAGRRGICYTFRDLAPPSAKLETGETIEVFDCFEIHSSDFDVPEHKPIRSRPPSQMHAHTHPHLTLTLRSLTGCPFSVAKWGVAAKCREIRHLQERSPESSERGVKVTQSAVESTACRESAGESGGFLGVWWPDRGEFGAGSRGVHPRRLQGSRCSARLRGLRGAGRLRA